jgi:MOSC domain-containing protein YiiM
LQRQTEAMRTLSDLMGEFPRCGRVEWIGLRSERRGHMNTPQQVSAEGGRLLGDRYQGRSGKRAVTLLQAEHLPVIASLLGVDAVLPSQLRRNLIVSGINLLALRGRRFQIGTVELEGTGPCAPCSRMEETFGPGGYNAVRGHGGITARIVGSGSIRVGDAVMGLESPVSRNSSQSDGA